MADEVLDLASNTNPGEDPKAVASMGQFHRDLSYLLMDEATEGEEPLGPVITLGSYVLQFKQKAPVNALGHLIEGGLNGMRQYVLLCLEDFSKADFQNVQNRIDVDGLGVILNALGEGYTSFPAKS